MGAEKSIPQGFATNTTCIRDNYVPMGGTRLGNEMTGHVYSPSKTAHVHKTKLLKTHAEAVWTVMYPNGDSPCSRTAHWSVYEPKQNRLYIGYGLNEMGEPLNDVWAFDFALQKWAQIPVQGEQISPRSGTKGALFQHYIVLYGGFGDQQYIADFHILDLETFEISRPALSGDAPSPRTAPLVAVYGSNVYVWGGYNGQWPSELYVLDTSTLTWTEKKTDLFGRTAFSDVQIGKNVYIFGGSQVANAGYVLLDCETCDINPMTMYGLEINTRIMNSSVCSCGPFLVLIGGKSDSPTNFLFAFHLERKSWFLLNVIPDGETVTVADGEVTETGLFKLPRNVSISLVYQKSERTIYGFLGSPHSSPPPILKLAMDVQIAFCNIQDDMLEMLK